MGLLITSITHCHIVSFWVFKSVFVCFKGVQQVVCILLTADSCTEPEAPRRLNSVQARNPKSLRTWICPQDVFIFGLTRRPSRDSSCFFPRLLKRILGNQAPCTPFSDGSQSLRTTGRARPLRWNSFNLR